MTKRSNEDPAPPGKAPFAAARGVLSRHPTMVDGAADLEDEDPREGSDRAYRLHDVKIMIVEDEPDTRELVAMCLERIGASVLAVPAAEDALLTFEEFAPDILLSDLSLPQMDGVEMLRQLRRTAAGRTVPAMALSASASLDDAARAIAAGFDAHVAKPVSGDELIRAVLAILDVKHGTTDEPA